MWYATGNWPQRDAGKSCCRRCAIVVGMGLSGVLVLLALVGCEWREMTPEESGGKKSTSAVPQEASSSPIVMVMKVAAAPVLDGKGSDVAWQKAPASILAMRGYSAERIAMQVVYTDTDIFFLLSWSDYSHSVRQAGSWGRVHVGAQFGKAATEAVDKWERFGVEDALSLVWNLDAPDFGQGDFSSRVHLPGIPVSAGRMDRWFWAAGTTDPAHYVLDQHLDPHGLHDDSGTSFLVPNFTDKDDPKTSLNEYAYPVFMPRLDLTQRKIPRLFAVQRDKPVLLYYRSEVDPFDLAVVDREATLPGYIFEDAPSGSVIDLTVRSVYAATDETWTLEIQRKLTTQTPQEDVQFTDFSRTYPFVIGVFDNTDVDGSFSDVYQLRFAR
ncbi:hypothetical protein NKDENANG_00788 [Candidatus Entotheonellaceae bacterium PAL068K]